MKYFNYSHIGKRPNQEDTSGCANTIFFVCDGVGGHAKGEVASAFIKEFILQSTIILSKTGIEQVLINAQIALNKEYGQNHESSGMGTTFCGLFFSKEGAFIAYIGDSRLYWLKPHQNKLWHTWDHSIVGELVKSGEISREQGRHHPMNNRISKAIIANKENKTTIPEIYKIDNIENGDLFFLCTDGVNEAWSDSDLINVLLSTDSSSEEKLNTIKQKCIEQSNDNNTAILIEIEAKDEIKNGTNDEIKWLGISEINEDNRDNEKVDSQDSIDENEENSNHKKVLHSSIIFLLFLIVVLAAYYFLYKK